MVIASANPKLSRFKYAAMLLGAVAVAGTPLAYPAIAATAPTGPPRPIQVPSDIATVSTVSKGNEAAS